MRIETEIKLDFKDVLFKPKRSTLLSRREVGLERTFKFLHSPHTWNGVPIIASNMDSVATFECARALSKEKLITCLHKHYKTQEYINYFNEISYVDTNHTAFSLGISEDEFARLCEIQKKTGNKIKILCIDVANGYTERFISFVAKVRSKFKDCIIIAGNVVTAEITEQLLLAGADIVKVGIGSGSVCTTRIQAGVGYPQLSAVIECADASHGLGGRIMSDGGCTCAGDVSKAFGGGADFVMLGGMFAGHDENVVLGEDGSPIFYGMSSDTAMDKYNGGLNKYRSSEGRTVRLSKRGSILNTVRDLLGGVRSTCTYIGARELRELSKCTTFIRVSQQYNPIYESKTI